MNTMRRARSRKVQCPFCPTTFTRTEHLQRHLGSHGVGKAVTCPECGKEFMRKDVLKRHLAKCQLKLKTRTDPPDSPEPDRQQEIEQAAPQGHLKQSEAGATEPTQYMLPSTPSADTWGEINFEDIRFLFDPTYPELQREDCSKQIMPSAFGVPCINIDPADTFNFLARIANKETASLRGRYHCSLSDRQWAELEASGSPADAPGVDSIDTYPPPSYQIVQQIKIVSQQSKITHTWSPQLERDCTRFFSPGNLEKFTLIYWTAWHPHYPVIHKPTFSIAAAPVHLTAAMSIIGACFSPNENDRQNAKLWLNSVEEMVFTSPYFGDISLQDLALINIRDIVQLLQAAYCVSSFQISEGSKVSQQRIRRQRFGSIVSLARDLNLFSIVHDRNINSLCGRDFCWESFVATEECIRTMLFIYIHDIGFSIFSNLPQRTRIQEMALDMACPEACFQAQSASECFSAIKTWTSHPLWKCGKRLRDIVEVILCMDLNQEMQAYITHLGVLNLCIVCHALVSEALQLNALLSINIPLQPIRRAIHNWKAAWNQRYVIQDNFGLPKEEDRIVARPGDAWRRVGFFQNAAEYWLLVHILIDRIEEQQWTRQDRVTSDAPDCSDMAGTSVAISTTRPYTPSRCDSPTMVDLKHLIMEHHRRFGADI
ncbi:hypothetical protein BJX63DRAFT_423902 [Aspergillus granulosus]|uniref:C2H2-type domain-containing protein n=1 Tax=Aspergillus granulosus TaxID=176169 RepID=A0ABR4H1S5_9EURO